MSGNKKIKALTKTLAKELKKLYKEYKYRKEIGDTIPLAVALSIITISTTGGGLIGTLATPGIGTAIGSLIGLGLGSITVIAIAIHDRLRKAKSAHVIEIYDALTAEREYSGKSAETFLTNIAEDIVDMGFNAKANIDRADIKHAAKCLAVDAMTATALTTLLKKEKTPDLEEIEDAMIDGVTESKNKKFSSFLSKQKKSENKSFDSSEDFSTESDSCNTDSESLT